MSRIQRTAANTGGGTEGKEGKQGPEGKEGKEGPIGPRGERGEKGETGLEGKTGKEGPAGKEGPEGKGAGPLTFVAVEALNAELENEPTGFAPVKAATGTDGISHLTGAVKAKKLIAQNTLLFTLPAGQRPTFKKQLLLALTSTSATAPRMQFELKTTGEVVNTGGTLEAAVTASFDDVTWAHEH
jgi:hypothetical protein